MRKMLRWKSIVDSLVQRYSVESFLGISMQVMVREDMVAHKLCAMYERIGKTNRDIFDVQFFLSRDWPINKKIIEGSYGRFVCGVFKKVY